VCNETFERQGAVVWREETKPAIGKRRTVDSVSFARISDLHGRLASEEGTLDEEDAVIGGNIENAGPANDGKGTHKAAGKIGGPPR